MAKRIGQEREKRLAKILKLIGRGLTSEEIAKEVGITLRMYFYDVKVLKGRMKEKEYMDEACLKMMTRREKTVRAAEAEYLTAREVKDKLAALQTMNRINDSTEKTYARLGLIPYERSGVDITADVHTHQEIHDIYQQCKKEKRKSGGSGSGTKT